MTLKYVISGPPYSGKSFLLKEMKNRVLNDEIYFMPNIYKKTYGKNEPKFTEEEERTRHRIYFNQVLMEDYIPEKYKKAIINKSLCDWISHDKARGFDTYKEYEEVAKNRYSKIFLLIPERKNNASEYMFKNILKTYLDLGYANHIEFIGGNDLSKKADIILEKILNDKIEDDKEKEKMSSIK